MAGILNFVKYFSTFLRLTEHFHLSWKKCNVYDRNILIRFCSIGINFNNCNSENTNNNYFISEHGIFQSLIIFFRNSNILLV